jgi:cobalamin biosynthesis Mg chelatase CobN
MRTQGDDIGEVLALLGVRPIWQAESRRVTGTEVIPLAELGRPQFFQETNPWALRSIIERLMEAGQRGLWAQPDQAQLAQMGQLYLRLEGELEERSETV